MVKEIDVETGATVIRDKIAKTLKKKIQANMRKDKKIFRWMAHDSLYTEDGKIKSEVPHMRVIEFGLPPFQDISYEGLREWVALSGKIPHNGTDEDIDEITTKIYNKIQKDGIEPSRVVKRTLVEFVQ